MIIKTKQKNSYTKPNEPINAQTKWNQHKIAKRKKRKKIENYELYIPDYNTIKNTLLDPFWDKPKIKKYP